MKHELSDYEIQRAERIKRNKQLLDSLFPDLEEFKPPKQKVKIDIGGKRKERRRRTSAPYLTEQRPLLIRRNPGREARTSVSTCPEGAILCDPTEPGMLDDEYFEGCTMKFRFSGKLGRSFEPEKMEIVLESDEEDDVEYYNKNTAKPAFHVMDKVYNKERGTTCHQCRQKTLDAKTRCHNKLCKGVRGQFCGVCLLNRYGEDVVEAIADKKWVCPPCRGYCNCSFCLPKRGKCPTGILTPYIKARGFHNVKDYLASFEIDEPNGGEIQMEMEGKEYDSEDENKENIAPKPKIKCEIKENKPREAAPLAPKEEIVEVTVDDIRASTEKLNISAESPDESESAQESMIFSPLPKKKPAKKSSQTSSLRNSIKRCLVIWKTSRFAGGYQWLHPSKVTDLNYSDPQVGGSVKIKWGKSSKLHPATLVDIEKRRKGLDDTMSGA